MADGLLDVLQLQTILNPFEAERRIIARNTNMRFVHYTSPEAALKMIRNAEVWMRKSSTMNDFSEIQHGLGCLDYVMNMPSLALRFRSLIDGSFPGLAAEIEGEFHKWRYDLLSQTYLTCISEHGGTEEDKYGRLSMWRAYGGIGVVLNPTAFMGATDALATYSSPVRYRDREEFLSEFAATLEGMERQRNFIAARDRMHVRWALLQMFRSIALCTKHPAFKEEREWRIFHSPNYQSSPRLKREIEIIRGIPQPVFKLPLESDPSIGLNGLSVPELIDRVLIGPTPDPQVQAEAFVEEMRLRRVGNPFERIVVTAIPLRQ